MDQIGFYNYLLRQGVEKKVCSDHVSRLKRIEKALKNCDLDEEYLKDRCKSLVVMMYKKNSKLEIKKRLIGTLPIGSYTMSTYRYSINKYIKYLDSLKNG